MSDEEKLSTAALIENKREMFDGMRAYHNAEISHTYHAVTMFLACFGATGAVMLAILFPETTPSNIVEISFGLFLMMTSLAFTIALTAHVKISSDHRTYAHFGEEYVRTCELLGFYDENVPICDSSQMTSLKKSKNIGQGTGYRKTQLLIWSVAFILMFFSLFFVIFVKYVY